ncbi:methyltransferase type 11 [Desulfovibrio sp. X2]|uniref:class I SAM-dependent methyltransferase n=1 Tax=Desulfovibrio sp. X2 TaxID=941449 RepID=UPI000358B982|nr:methyltransferase domain-containing protein [Desulfovibrio sp. X2]EPR43782.1 methyltransferase type 11 [Desulfovibrio sp. X2]
MAFDRNPTTLPERLLDGRNATRDAPRDRAAERDAFAARMTGILNASALGLAMAVGYRSGLFEAMDPTVDGADLPLGAAAIAERAGLSARYVREWLGAMAAGGVVRLVPGEEGEDLFLLPPGHADLLTLRAGPANLGVYAQEVPLLAQCGLDRVVEAFADGRGIAYEHYLRFGTFMEGLAEAKQRRLLLETFLPAVEDGALLERLRRGIRVCDVGCGEGLAVRLMAAAFPASSFPGLDIRAEAVAAARDKARQEGLANVRFLVRDAAAMPDADDTRLSGSAMDAESSYEKDFVSGFDYITSFDAIHDQTRPAEALSAIRAMLAPGGAFSMVDIAAHTRLADNLDHPLAPFLYTVSLMHCLPVGLVDGGAGLGMMWGRELAERMLREAGFLRVEVAPVPCDVFNLHFYCRAD